MPNGAALWHWDTGGAAAPVVLLHPHSGNHLSWDAQTPAFVAAGYRVIAYSRRGYHGSKMGPDDTPGTAVGDLVELLDRLKVETCHLVGSAAGGGVALDFMLSFPERLRSVVVASSFLSIVEPDFVAARARIGGDWFHAMPMEAQELSASYRALNPEGVARWLEIHHLNQAGPNRPVRGLKPHSRIDWPALAKNRVPLLLMTGDADLHMPPGLLRSVAPRVGAAELKIVPEAGHPIYFEAPKAFNEIVLAFLNRHEEA